MKSEQKAKPIIFAGESPRLILDGRTTQTRRLIRNPERLNGLMLEGEADAWCPYGGPGDLLWVRETWRSPWARMDAPRGGPTVYERGVEYHAGGSATLRDDAPIRLPYDGVSDFKVGGGMRWRPSRCMPRRASRILLERISPAGVEREQGAGWEWVLDFKVVA